MSDELKLVVSVLGILALFTAVIILFFRKWNSFSRKYKIGHGDEVGIAHEKGIKWKSSIVSLDGISYSIPGTYVGLDSHSIYFKGWLRSVIKIPIRGVKFVQRGSFDEAEIFEYLIEIDGGYCHFGFSDRESHLALNARICDQKK